MVSSLDGLIILHLSMYFDALTWGRVRLGMFSSSKNKILWGFVGLCVGMMGWEGVGVGNNVLHLTNKVKSPLPNPSPQKKNLLVLLCFTDCFQCFALCLAFSRSLSCVSFLCFSGRSLFVVFVDGRVEIVVGILDLNTYFCV